MSRNITWLQKVYGDWKKLSNDDVSQIQEKEENNDTSDKAKDDDDSEGDIWDKKNDTETPREIPNPTRPNTYTN